MLCGTVTLLLRSSCFLSLLKRLLSSRRSYLSLLQPRIKALDPALRTSHLRIILGLRNVTSRLVSYGIDDISLDVDEDDARAGT